MYCRRRKSKHSSDNFGVSRAESRPEIFQVDRATANERGFHLHYLFDCRQYFVTIRVMLILRGPKTFFFTCCRYYIFVLFSFLDCYFHEIYDLLPAVTPPSQISFIDVSAWTDRYMFHFSIQHPSNNRNNNVWCPNNCNKYLA